MSTNNLLMPDSLVVEESTNTYGKFVLQPLERGFGVTIGNAFRRVLLSSLPGIAITAVKIRGVKHEYSSIEGIAEDVYDIILNLKEVRFKQVEQSSGVITVVKEGPGNLLLRISLMLRLNTRCLIPTSTSLPWLKVLPLKWNCAWDAGKAMSHRKR
jgi:hypothetical protein